MEQKDPKERVKTSMETTITTLLLLERNEKEKVFLPIKNDLFLTFVLLESQKIMNTSMRIKMGKNYSKIETFEKLFFEKFSKS